MSKSSELLDYQELDPYKGKTPSRVSLKENKEKLIFTAYAKSYFNIALRGVGVLVFILIILFNLENAILPFFLLLFMIFYTIVAVLDKTEITIYPDSVEWNEKGWLMTTKKSIPIQNIEYIRLAELNMSKTVGRTGHSAVSAKQPVMLVKTVRTSYKIGMDLNPKQVLFMIPAIQKRVVDNYKEMTKN